MNNWRTQKGGASGEMVIVAGIGHAVVAPDWVLSIGQIELNCVLVLN